LTAISPARTLNVTTVQDPRIEWHTVTSGSFVAADNASDGMEAVRRLFSPEFRNRLDAIIQFAPLSPATIDRVVDKLLVEAEAQLEQKGVALSVDEPARRWIAVRGYDAKMGARPMARVIQEHIKRPLAEELLFGRLADGGQARVSVAGEPTASITISTPSPSVSLPMSFSASPGGAASAPWVRAKFRRCSFGSITTTALAPAT